MTPDATQPRPSRGRKWRDDIDPENTWVVSDTHFGHDNIVGFCFRPEDHEQVMIAQWRKVIPDDATVLHLGDLAYRGNARFKHLIAKELTGARKLLVMGNHDRQRFSFYKQSGFSVAKPFWISYDGPKPGESADISFSHYPWSVEEEGAAQQPWEWRLHGHIHNNGYTREGLVPFLRNHINLSAEQTKYTPVNLKELLDAAIFGHFEETTQASLDEAARRKAGER
jgi:calcineurin-like phosphoesterase family protein